MDSAGVLISSASSADLVNLANHEALIKLMVDERQSRPFSVRTTQSSTSSTKRRVG